MGSTTLKQTLDVLTAPAAPELTVPMEDRTVRCLSCAHRCKIKEGRRGICQVRFNRDGTLLAPHGYVAGLQVDPIEKKPFFHVLPGRNALSFGMLGCDLHCSFCQNWISSQALRDETAGTPVQEVDEQTLVQLALRHGAPTIVSTYNEPLITSDWARRIFEPARDAGLLTGYVSNGNATPEVLDFLQPAIDLFKVDLKTFSDRRYRELGGVLKHVLETIESLVARGIWVEVVTLLVPDFNNSDAELKELTGFLAGVSPDIPWHVTAFHPDYHMTGPRRTMASDLQRAYEIGRESGLRYVYAGNIAGGVGDGENTRCPDCNAMLVERLGFRVRECRVTSEGTCPDCGTSVPGVWTSPRASQKA